MVSPPTLTKSGCPARFTDCVFHQNLKTVPYESFAGQHESHEPSKAISEVLSPPISLTLRGGGGVILATYMIVLLATVCCSVPFLKHIFCRKCQEMEIVCILPWPGLCRQVAVNIFLARRCEVRLWMQLPLTQICRRPFSMRWIWQTLSKNRVLKALMVASCALWPFVHYTISRLPSSSLLTHHLSSDRMVLYCFWHLIWETILTSFCLSRLLSNFACLMWSVQINPVILPAVLLLNLMQLIAGVSPPVLHFWV